MRTEFGPLEGLYEFSPLRRVSFGPGTRSRLPSEIAALGIERVLVVAAPSIVRATSLIDELRTTLGSRLVSVFSSVRPYAPSDVVSLLADEIDQSGAGGIVSLGGGSSIDTAKAAIVAHEAASGMWLPHVAIPSTLSAAEFSPLYGVTDARSRVKHSHIRRETTPVSVILDAEIALQTPDWLWRGSGLRAIDHAVETIMAADHQPATDATSLEALRQLFGGLEADLGAEARLEARQQCMVGAWLSFFGVQNVSLGLSHRLGRIIGPRYDIPHGYTSAILLPHVMSARLEDTSGRQAIIARSLAGDPASLRGQTGAEEAARLVSSLVKRLGLPETLREVEVPRGDLVEIAAGDPLALRVLEDSW